MASLLFRRAVEIVRPRASRKVAMSIAFTMVMPTYNRGDLIAETLDAVLAHTLPPAEIIVIDGGSTDNTGAVQ